jgi:hypothetical protein
MRAICCAILFISNVPLKNKITSKLRSKRVKSYVWEKNIVMHRL